MLFSSVGQRCTKATPGEGFGGACFYISCSERRCTAQMQSGKAKSLDFVRHHTGTLLTLDLPNKEAYDKASYGERSAAYFHRCALIAMLSDVNASLEKEVSLRTKGQHQEADRLSEACPKWYQVFLNTQKIPGYREAEQSWIKAWSIFWSSHGYDRVVSPGKQVAEMHRQFFVVQCESDPINALKDNAQIVRDAAESGDLSFFLEIAKAVSRSKRRKKRTKNVKGISMWNILSRWLHGCLWLMSADRGSIALGELTGVRVTESNYTKLVQRLGLVSWKVAHKKPIINGYSPKTRRFLFAPGWTHLDADLSK